MEILKQNEAFYLRHYLLIAKQQVEIKLTTKICF